MDDLPTTVDPNRPGDPGSPVPDFLERATHGIRLRGDDHAAAPAAVHDPTAPAGTRRLAA